jgi:hypothetical protein
MRCFEPFEAVIPVCVKLRCPSIVEQWGRDVTYSMPAQVYDIQNEFVAAFGIYEQGARADFSCQYSIALDRRFVMVFPNPKYSNGFDTVLNTALPWSSDRWDSHVRLPDSILANNSRYHQECWEREDRTHSSQNEWTAPEHDVSCQLRSPTPVTQAVIMKNTTVIKLDWAV